MAGKWQVGSPKPLKNWGGRRESNPQQPEPQSGALPVELLPPDVSIITCFRVSQSQDHELTKTFHHLKPSAQGKLNTLEPIANNATISGIEALDEAQSYAFDASFLLHLRLKQWRYCVMPLGVPYMPLKNAMT